VLKHRARTRLRAPGPVAAAWGDAGRELRGASMTHGVARAGVNEEGQSMVKKVFAVSASSGRGIAAVRSFLRDAMPQVLLTPLIPSYITPLVP